ncbi:MAG: hypothetical protein JWN02_157 [Acidobacteria bacterium]|nr:hypothetical protein [Acidobacteriota bacterium]
MIHIHNGDVVATRAERSGIPGTHIPFREALVTGPVALTYDVETRAQWLASAHGDNLLRVRNELRDQQQTLEAARTAHGPAEQEIVLWFEHDLFCLANLLYLLDRLAGHPHLSLVWSPEALSQPDLQALYQTRAAVTPAMLELGRSAWRAYASSDPLPLDALLLNIAPSPPASLQPLPEPPEPEEESNVVAFESGPVPAKPLASVLPEPPGHDFPFLREGLALHASRFPALRDGLGLVERRVLALLAGGPLDFGTLFTRFDPDVPRLGYGDSQLLADLRAMAWTAVPLLTITEVEGTPPKSVFTITPAGESVLSGSVDALTLNDPDSWLGGIHVTRENVWRWDEERQQISRSLSAGS